jgi:hypothetical protein
VGTLRVPNLSLVVPAAATSTRPSWQDVCGFIGMATEGSRPLLAPQTRRLRHLQGIYLRNLTLLRPRGHTIDDASLNKTPEKLESLRKSLHEPSLQHSASSDDLNANIRPSGRRRRSTIWAGQSPDYRQRKLEDVIDNGMVDAFFSLHCAGEDEPIYISEVTEKAMVRVIVSGGRCQNISALPSCLAV